MAAEARELTEAEGVTALEIMGDSSPTGVFLDGKLVAVAFSVTYPDGRFASSETMASLIAVSLNNNPSG